MTFMKYPWVHNGKHFCINFFHLGKKCMLIIYHVLSCLSWTYKITYFSSNSIFSYFIVVKKCIFIAAYSFYLEVESLYSVIFPKWHMSLNDVIACLEDTFWRFHTFLTKCIWNYIPFDFFFIFGPFSSWLPWYLSLLSHLSSIIFLSLIFAVPCSFSSVIINLGFIRRLILNLLLLCFSLYFLRELIYPRHYCWLITRLYHLYHVFIWSLL